MRNPDDKTTRLPVRILGMMSAETKTKTFTAPVEITPHEDGEHCGECGWLKKNFYYDFYHKCIFKNWNGRKIKTTKKLDTCGTAIYFFIRHNQCLEAERKAKVSGSKEACAEDMYDMLEKVVPALDKLYKFVAIQTNAMKSHNPFADKINALLKKARGE